MIFNVELSQEEIGALEVLNDINCDSLQCKDCPINLEYDGHCIKDMASELLTQIRKAN